MSKLVKTISGAVVALALMQPVAFGQSVAVNQVLDACLGAVAVGAAKNGVPDTCSNAVSSALSGLSPLSVAQRDLFIIDMLTGLARGLRDNGGDRRFNATVAAGVNQALVGISTAELAESLSARVQAIVDRTEIDFGDVSPGDAASGVVL